MLTIKEAMAKDSMASACWLVGWEIFVPFQHKNRLYREQGLGWSGDLVPDLVAFLFSDDPKWERIGEAHLSYYASIYNRVKTNQTPQDLFISSMRYLV